MVKILIVVGILALLIGPWLYKVLAPEAGKKLVLYGLIGVLVVVGLFLAASGRAILDLPIVGAILWLGRGWFTHGMPGIGWMKSKVFGTPDETASGAKAQADDPRRANFNMTTEEAWQVLGLQPGATAEGIREAHRSLMMKMHPDHGGSTYLARQINAARDLLLERLSG